jgi:hypothetical protein
MTMQEAIDALERYGEHDVDCETHQAKGNTDCVCGYDAAVARLKAGSRPSSKAPCVCDPRLRPHLHDIGCPAFVRYRAEPGDTAGMYGDMFAVLDNLERVAIALTWDLKWAQKLADTLNVAVRTT